MRKSLRNIRRYRASRRIRRTNRKTNYKRNRTKGGRALINTFSRLFSKAPRVAPESSPIVPDRTPTPNSTLTFEDLIVKYNKEIDTIRTQLNSANTDAINKINDKELPGNNPTLITVALYKEYLEAIIRDANNKLDEFHNSIQTIQDAFTQELSIVADTKKINTIRRDFRSRARNLYVNKPNIRYVITGYGGSIQTLLRNLDKGEPDPFKNLLRSNRPTLF